MWKKSDKKQIKRGAVKQKPSSAFSARHLVSPSNLKRGLHCFLSLSIVIVLVGASYWVKPKLQVFLSQPMTEVEFIGYSGGEFVGANTGGISEEELLELSLPYLSESYWLLSVEQVKNAIEKHPWVRHATVSKRWPDTLIVGVDEFVPVARWNHNYLMSMTGELFSVINIEAYASLPHFSIAWEEKSEESFVRHLVKEFNVFQQILNPTAMQVAEFGLRTIDSAWLATKQGLRIELGRQDQTMRLQRFVDLYMENKLGDLQNWDTVDLRYDMGFAVKYKQIKTVVNSVDLASNINTSRSQALKAG